MTRYVVDALTLLNVVAQDIAVHEGHQIVAPGRIRFDVLALLFDAVHRGDLAEKVALERHERLTEMKIRLLNDRVSRRTAWRIAREQGWASIRDAEYVAITRLQADALVTTDSTLMAKAQGLVPLAPVSALTTRRAPPPSSPASHASRWLRMVTAMSNHLGAIRCRPISPVLDH